MSGSGVVSVMKFEYFFDSFIRAAFLEEISKMVIIVFFCTRKDEFDYKYRTINTISITYVQILMRCVSS